MRAYVGRLLIVGLLAVMLAVTVSAIFPHCDDMSSVCDILCSNPCEMPRVSDVARQSDIEVNRLDFREEHWKTVAIPTPTPPPKLVAAL